LGKGGFGVVNLMHDKVSNCDVAVKFFTYVNNSEMVKKEA